MVLGMSRRTLGAAALLPFVKGASAQGTYPTRPVTLLVGFAPGGGTDIIARLLSSRLNEAFGQPVVVENRPGSSGTIAASAVLRARPDGYTLGIGSNSSNAIVPPLMRPSPFDPMKDQTAILHVGTVPLAVAVPANSRAKDLRDFIEMCKARPGGVNYATAGVGTQQHFAAELFARATGTQMTHVPYRGSGQALSDLIAGQVDVNFDTLPSVLSNIRAGTLRALAVTTPERVDWLPEVPTVAEAAVPGFEVVTWYLAFGPAGLPAPVVARWADALNAALSDPTMRAQVRDAGFIPGGGTSDAAAARVRADSERFGALARAVGIALD